MSGDRVVFAARGSGILLHPTSLSVPFYVGDLGPQARRFALALFQAGQPDRHRDTRSSAGATSAAEIEHERAFALRYSGSDGK
jgi:hypothetical protein